MYARSLMTRLFVAAGLGILLAGSAVSWAAAEEKAASPLPLKKVVLFNSGVGFFEHNAEITGDARIDLKFNVEDINDLLKSMVLQDMGGGKVSTVTYGSQDPITKTLKTFSIDLTSNPTMAGLLQQVRGEKVEVEAPNKILGTIVGVEKRRQQVGEKEVVENEFLTLLTEEGLRSVALANVSRIRLVSEKLDAELRQALMVLALGHSTDKKTVSLNFLGQGKRPVRVGYIQESPIWKTSYRLVLKDGEAPFLQGWAIVENTTEEDWKDVGLTLVSGRPISFVMNLYQPLYVPRPLVEPELFASLRPQTYGQDLAAANREFEQKRDGVADYRKAAADMAPNAKGEGRDGLAMARRQAGAAGRELQESDKQLNALQLNRGVQSAAQAGDVGEMFQYVIDMPVTLPRQQSAMLPIVNGSVQGDKVSIYNARVHVKHPLNGLKLTNSTGLHLMQGPITVFDGGTYAGDARIEDLTPGSERLISYAMDLDTEVAPESKGGPEELTSVKLVKGVLHASRRYHRTQDYTIKNSGKGAKQVLIEYPYDSTWKLLAPEKPAEKTRDMYRFMVKAEPGKPAKLSVQEEQVVSQQWALNNLDDNSIRLYISAKVVSEDVKKALTEVIRRKQELQQLLAQQGQLEQQIKVIDQEQARIRQNMAQLDRNSDVYNRYVKKFGEQEDQVEKLRGQISELVAQVAAKRKSLDDYLIGLNLQ
jgi:hypothetical protein